VNIPGIGTAGGIFEMFVPGAFLVINIFIVVYTALDDSSRESLVDLASNPILSLVILICFGYLTGVIMRLFRTEVPDRWSARLLRFTSKDAKVNSDTRLPFKVLWNPEEIEDKAELEKTFKLWAIEHFPYIGWLGYTHAASLASEDPADPEPVGAFHKQVWALDRTRRQDKTFFNFCKTLIASVDERAAAEIHSAEALNRYLTGMFYSLLLSLFLMATGLAIHLIFWPGNTSWVVFLVLFVIYIAMFLAIVRQFRISRIKEAEIVFSTTYRHRDLFEPSKPEAPLPWRERLRLVLAILTGHES
jgi:hypothetical protein